MTISASTPLQPWGILPYGADDPSIILRSSMTSAASVETPDIGDGGSVIGTPTFDSVKGFTNTSGENCPQFLSVTGYNELEIGGQISMQIEKKFIASGPSGVDLGGVDHAANAFFFTASTNNTQGTLTSRWWMQQSSDKLITQQYQTDDQNPISLALEGEDEFVTLTVSWNGSTYDRYINGRPLSIGLLNEAPYLVDAFKYMHIGSNVRAADTGMLGYYMRNLQISTRPVMHPTHPTLANMVVIGHSFVVYAKEPTAPATVGWDMSTGRAIKSYLNERGVGATITYYDESGAVLDTNLSGTTLDAQFVAAIATRPTAAVIIAGTNDCHHANWNPVTFESEYKRYIDDLDATCEIINVCTITTQKANTTYDTDTVVANVAEGNAIINDLVNYNPKVSVSDDFSVLGGESLGSNYFEGERTGALNNLHPSAKGLLASGLNVGRVVYLAI